VRLACGLLALAFLLVGGTGCSRRAATLPVGIVTEKHGAYAKAIQDSLDTMAPGLPASDLIDDLALPSLPDDRLAAYLVDQATARIAEGNLLVVAVSSQAGKDQPLILVKTKLRKYYLAENAAVLSLVVLHEGLDKAWIFDQPGYYPEGTLKAKEGSQPEVPSGQAFFSDPARVAALIAQLSPALALPAKKQTADYGTPSKNPDFLSFNPPHTAGQTVSGEVLFIDSEGNLVTNIPKNVSPWLKEGTLLRVLYGKERLHAPLVGTPSEVPVGRYAAIYSPDGKLLIIVNKGSAARLLKAHLGDTFTVEP